MPTKTFDWILIRGLAREAAHWGDFASTFRNAFPAHRVHLLDLPGNGAHHRRRTPLTVGAMTEAVRREARALGAKRPCVLGHSLGGMVACDWAQRHPQEVTGVVLCNTSSGGLSKFVERCRPAATKTLIRLVGLRAPLRRERLLLSLESTLRTDLDRLVAHRVEIHRARPVSLYNAIRQIIAALRFRAAAEPPAVPYLILCGLGDRFVSPCCSEKIAATWGGTVAAHPAAGHDLMLDAGHWVIEQIRSWLPGLGQVAPISAAGRGAS